MVVNDGSHGNLGEFSHVRWIDHYISIAPRTVCRDIAWNPFIWGPLDHGVLQNVPTKPIHWSCKLVKPCKTSTSPGSIPVISPFSIHWPKSTPLGMRLQVFSFDEVFEAWNTHDFPWIFPYPCQVSGGNAMNPQKGCRSYCRFTTTCTFENIFECGFCL